MTGERQPMDDEAWADYLWEQRGMLWCPTCFRGRKDHMVTFCLPDESRGVIDVENVPESEYDEDAAYWRDYRNWLLSQEFNV